MTFQKLIKTTNVSIQVIKAKVDHLQYVSNAINEQKKVKKKIQKQLIKILLVITSCVLDQHQKSHLKQI